MKLDRDHIVGRMELVNDYWISQTPESGDAAWERAAYMMGDIAAYEVTGREDYLDRAVDWARANRWNFHDNARFNTTNADNLSCGETYMDLMLKYGIDGDWGPMVKTMEYTVADPANDYWWWVDTIYMALDFYNRIGLHLDDGRLLEKAWRLFLDSKVKRGCYDEEEHLWFRDEDFLPDRARTKSGRKVFWSRGNGWVLAGLARTLRTLGPRSPYFEGYRNIFVPMAEAICRHQSPDGFWRTSLLEPDEFPMRETSGTALDVLGLLIGYREGLLCRDSLECALKGFEALDSVAVSPEGRIGWVQGVALKPGPVEKENTNDYAVGTYLLICRELSALL